MMPAHRSAQSGSSFGVPATVIVRDGKNPGWTLPANTSDRIDELLNIKSSNAPTDEEARSSNGVTGPECESTVHGVRWNRQRGKWVVRFYADKKAIYLGVRDTYHEAVNLQTVGKLEYEKKKKKRETTL